MAAKELLYGLVLHQPIRLSKRRENAHRARAFTATETPDSNADRVASTQPGQIPKVVAKRPERFDGSAVGAFPGWTNLSLIVFSDVVLRIYRDWLN